MKLTYQSANFDYARSRKAIATLQAQLPAVAKALDTVTVGDPSCLYRLEHTLGKACEIRAFSDFSQSVRNGGRRLFLQLPITTKEQEYDATIQLATAALAHVDGFVSGDLGVLDALQCLGAALVHHGNLVNRHAAATVQQLVGLECTRPLFLRERFLRADPAIARDVVAFGPMLLSCSTFCVHCGDLPTACDYSCAAPKSAEMEGELVHMVGRALFTQRRMDLLDMLADIPGAVRGTVVDLQMTEFEWLRAAKVIAETPENPPTAAAKA